MAPRGKIKRLRSKAPSSSGLAHSAKLKDQLLCEMELQQTIAAATIDNLEKNRTQLENSRNSFAALYHQAPVGFITLDSLGCILDANAEAGRLFGLDRERLRGQPFTFFVAPADVHSFLTHLTRCRSGKTGRVATEVRILAKNPSPLLVQLVSVPLAGTGSNMLFTALVDLTERCRNEEALEEAKKFSESIVQTVREPLAVLNQDFRVVSVNRAFVDFFGKPEGFIQGRPFDVLLNLWWSGNRLRHELERVLLRSEPIENFELEIELAGLGKRRLLLNARRLHRKDSPSLMLVAIEDITAKKQAEDSQQRMTEELERRMSARTEALEQSYKQMESFCHSIAHDLRGPLRSMTCFSHLLIQDYGFAIGEEGRDYADRIQASAERMDWLIRDLLDYGRLNTIQLASEEVDLQEIWRDVLHQAQGEVRERHAIIEQKADLPRVLGQRAVLQVCLQNLLSNAIKFVAPGTIPHVVVAGEEREHRVRIWICDNGIGISQQNQSRIFGIFQRLHPMDRYPGTGIGLALVSKGIERIGGRVGVDSQPGQGSRFWIELPRPEKPQR